MNLENLSAATRLLAAAGFETTTQAAIVLEAAAADERGTPHTVMSLAKAARLSQSTGARVAWQMQQAGWIRYEDHPTDRRVKIVKPNMHKIRRLLATKAKAA